MADEEKLKLGKGAAFVKSRLKTLPQGNETWEADFQALPKPIDQSVTHYLGMVVTEEERLAPGRPRTVHGRPSVNDLATLLAHAMRRPLDGEARRPRLVRLRGHHQWRGLFPHLEEIGVGVEVLVGQASPASRRRTRPISGGCGTSTGSGWSSRRLSRSKVEAMFPAIDRWVKEYGWIEIGVQELFGFVARAFDEGGTQVEDDRAGHAGRGDGRPGGGPVRWFEEQGDEIT